MSDTEDEVLDEEQEGEEPLEEANVDEEAEEEEEGEDKGEEKEEEEREEEETPPHVPLTEEMLKEGLSLLCKTGNGLGHAYVKLEVQDKELTDISVLESFIHLRYVDLSNNSLRDLTPLGSLTHLLSLRVDQNQLVSVSGLGQLPYLQQVSLAQNRLQNLQGLAHPRLESLNLIGNEIHILESLDCPKLNSLHTLELRGNKLQSTAGLYLPSLRELYLAQNNIKTLGGLDNLVHLTSLHLRDNQLENLDGFSENMRALQYLNLRGNLIPRLQEVEKLRVLPMLRALVLRENPCEEEDGYRLETLIALPHLERLDKDFFEEEERTEAAETQKSRMEDGITES
ncbi:leucine-rich repeat-containing protein 23 isoform X1 [Hyla sarda]|uniref:leucine-rich repeat-containing protein 23 isoform X1 n=1 Tax=Hyla sarda TaxID=327740 RepID=UPI0024C28C4D|nr:leucine-rich repeat-containing protein 23 isoform X1 [Hyla sarda]XP_056385968.1 leucine-rich repeat-containing protein 23 isoform X1 [Hyla sarda]XP_056385969.1 leucine-rich repeat-containing protein 23 isoform X1 [Hyla sarda]